MIQSDDTISRQAAIEAMLDLQKEDDDAYGCHIPEAFHGERAAEALRTLPSAQQDCTECADYDHKTKSCPYYCEVIRKTADELQVEASCKLPERKTGRWILSDTQRQEDVDNGNYQFICSECGKADIHSKAVAVSFCWNCGARMEGEG